MSNEPRYGYMCKVDFDWELGEALGGTAIYPSVEDLKAERKCVSSCGIVKVKIELEEVVDAGERWKDDSSENK
jgi:hypothetical protein